MVVVTGLKLLDQSRQSSSAASALDQGVGNDQGSGSGLRQRRQSPDGRYGPPGLSGDVSGRPDLNRGPPAPEAGALTGLRYAPYYNEKREREKPKRSRLSLSAHAVSMRPEGLEPPAF